MPFTEEYGMTDSSQGFNEELRAQIASLARALRSFKTIKKKLLVKQNKEKRYKRRKYVNKQNLSGARFTKPCPTVHGNMEIPC